MDPAPRVIPPPTPLVSLCAWLVPGGGYWLLGERVRAVLVGVCVLGVFALGVLVGGIRVVDAPSEFGVQALLQKPWFMGQVLAGPVSVAAAVTANRTDPLRVSHGRSWEIGTLYTAVAGMLNLLAVIDSAHRAGRGPEEDEGSEP